APYGQTSEPVRPKVSVFGQTGPRRPRAASRSHRMATQPERQPCPQREGRPNDLFGHDPRKCESNEGSREDERTRMPTAARDRPLAAYGARLLDSSTREIARDGGGGYEATPF